MCTQNRSKQQPLRGLGNKNDKIRMSVRGGRKTGKEMSRLAVEAKNLNGSTEKLFLQVCIQLSQTQRLVWVKGLKPDPICFLCFEFENKSHLFDQCEGRRRFLLVIGVNTMYDILLDLTVLKVKICVYFT